jgi:cell division protein FtsQ
MGKEVVQKSDLRIQIAVGIAVAAGVLLAALFAFYRFEQFLIRDSRFAMALPESGEASPIQIHGVNYASHREIESLFAVDYGRSVYLLPLAERREMLRTVDWVRDASVSRVWPNQVEVRVDERKPVAFVMLGSSRVAALIDQDGAVMQSVSAQFHLPVLKGIRASDSPTSRREKVQRMMRFTHEIGAAADQISEIDTTDRENLEATQPYEGRSITLELGARDFGLRYRNFVNHIGEIKKKFPRTAILDLRLENKITAADE